MAHYRLIPLKDSLQFLGLKCNCFCASKLESGVWHPQRYGLALCIVACFFVGTLTPRACPIEKGGLTPTNIINVPFGYPEVVPKGTLPIFTSMSAMSKVS